MPSTRMQAAIHHAFVGRRQDTNPVTLADKSFNAERSNVTTATTGLRLGVSGRRPELSVQIKDLWLTKCFFGLYRLRQIGILANRLAPDA